MNVEKDVAEVAAIVEKVIGKRLVFLQLLEYPLLLQPRKLVSQELSSVAV